MENRMQILDRRIAKLNAMQCTRRQLDRMYALKGQCEKEFYAMFLNMTAENKSINFLMVK